ncbi:hypothetical protein EZJ19_08070, partial [Parasulfuritortus cantonensis]
MLTPMALDVLMPPTPVGLPLAFTLGLVFGMGPCLLACMPYLGPVFLNSDGGVRQSWRLILPVSLGRLTGYAGFGAASGLAGRAMTEAVGDGTVGLVLGLAALLVGFALWRARGSGRCAAPAAGPVRTLRRIDRRAPLMPGGLYLMGLAMALTPCAPLGLVLVAAAALASAAGGALLGLAFGLGAVLVPGLVYGLGLAWFGP